MRTVKTYTATTDIDIDRDIPGCGRVVRTIAAGEAVTDECAALAEWLRSKGLVRPAEKKE